MGNVLATTGTSAWDLTRYHKTVLFPGLFDKPSSLRSTRNGCVTATDIDGSDTSASLLFPVTVQVPAAAPFRART